MPATDDLRLLHKQERAMRISLDNIKEFVQSINDGADRRSLDMRIARLDDIWQQFIDIRMRIELITDGVDDEISTDETEETEEARLQRQVRVQRQRDRENSKIIKDFENEVYRLKESMFGFLQSTSSSALQVQQHQSVAVPQSKVKLPELKLPTFNGRISDWVTFRDTYKNLIHNDTGLSNMDKFTYLRTSLIGDALQEIASIEISSANYAIAWTALENAFENKKLLVMTHLDSLFALEPLRQENYESLSKLVNGFEKNLQMLSKIGENPEGWSTLLQYMLCKRLHPTTLRQWESHYNSKEVPRYADLIKFLKSHCSVLQSISPGRQFQAEPRKIVRPSTSHAGIQSSGCCPFCGESAHSAFKCAKFSKMRISERVDAVRKNSLCLNCLSPAHIARFCTRGSCYQCGQRHHSLLHVNSSTTANSQNRSGPFQGNQSNKKPQGQNTQPPQTKPTPNGHATNTQQTQQSHPESTTNSTTNASNAHSHTPATDGPSTSYHTAPLVNTQHVPHTVLLSTAVVNLYDQYGNSLLARALLDSGSQRCYMSENISQKLKFKRTREHLPIVGIGGSRTASAQAICAEVHSLVTNYVTNLKFHVLPRVTVDLPTRSIDIRSWNIPKEIILADPTFNESGAVDLIIGAEVYLKLMIAERQIKLGDTGPTLQNTLLGWIVSGGSPEVSTSLTTVSSCATENIEEGLARFFELESCRTTSTLSLEESACELHFEKTTTRDSSGRFVVQLPKKQFMLDRLGESQSIAIRRFMALERRLDADPAVKKMYTEFIEEYLRMQHMREISPRELSTFPVAYFLPHHAVIKPDSTTTKLRVVFDASCATTTRVSLNDVLMVGPVVQEDLNSITLRFRLRKYTITADVEKMYRMMKTHRLDHPLHCIVWRADSGKPLRIFVLTTVTYGTSSAPYLATRCLKKLAEEEKGNFPAAADTIIYDFYVDDMLKSIDSIEEGVQLSKDLIHVLGTAGLTLRKWSSNSREIMDSIPPYLRDERSSLDLEPSNSIVKTLGLKWEPRSDVFRFTVPQWNPATELNKRIILSDFAKLFDPLGLVGPTLVQAKVFLQDLWRTKCSWNDTLPEELQNWWREFREGLERLRLLQVPRWVAF
ncbi:uncharacterized protein LOC135707752 [Ochlerotatus camptorhynchus]|uniref:uncharacterized protein LOC135707752 n=1 Tax=Ochlerotatus camptorhynchus TaxID=644619 RepID=UPI0031E2860F